MYFLKQKNNIIDEILLRDDYLHDSLLSLIKDKYGNYVVQKMIENSEKDKREEIIQKILNSYLIKRKEGYTKHVLNYIDKLGYNIYKGNFNFQKNVNIKKINVNNVNNINNNINNNNGDNCINKLNEEENKCIDDVNYDINNEALK